MRPRLKQQGFALLVFVTLLATAAATVTVKALNNNENTQIDRDKITAAALAQAKDALIGYAITYSDANPHNPSYMNGYLPNPDLGPGESSEGNAAGSFAGNHTDYTAIGKIPWKKIGISPSRDGQGECLWYVVSGRFKNTPKTDTLNWDTQGQIDIIDENANPIASNIAALVVAPGRTLDGQNRTLSDSAYTRCGGNYDARNYLDSYSSSDAVSGEVNYFTNSTNNRLAPNTSNKWFVFVTAKNDHYNDRFLLVSVDDIFRPIIQRNDFRDQISALLNDGVFILYLKTVTITGSKGTNNINCDNTSNSDNQNFCNNWKEMLLLTQLSTPAAITIDGLTTTPCSRVLIFGGQKTGAQSRLTSTDKTTPANYLEGGNLAVFATPVAIANNFNGVSNFSASNPSADLLRCIP